jgi:hypothetical protein
MAEETLRPSARALRARLENLIAKDLLGPAGGPHEEVEESRVSERYVVGMLAARRIGLNGGTGADHQPEEEAIEDDLAVAGAEGGEEGGPEPAGAAVEQLVPASMGLSFAVDADTDELVVTASWGRYARGPSEHATTESGQPRRVWRREPCAGRARRVALRDGELDELVPDPDHPEVIVRGRARTHGAQRLVTLFLVNGQLEPDQDKDAAWLFQAELTVQAPGGRAAFVSRRPPGQERRTDLDREEAEGLDMVHRDRVELAVGHNVAVHAEPSPDDPARGTRLTTAVIPVAEVPLTEAPAPEEDEQLAQATFDMRELARAGRRELGTRLAPLVDAYEAWIEHERARIDDPAARLGGHERAAQRHLDRCVHAAARLRAGIAALADPAVAEAFAVANEAMWRQRVRTLVAERRARGDSQSIEDLEAQLDAPRNRSWRPFQLAFVLLNLPGIAQLDHPERGEEPGLVDLLWFPTGGGKTEAYLGLTAFTLALRRLRGQEGGRSGAQGVGVLMRYTLRLLTLQQFQRATALICALEVIRRERAAGGDARLGAEPFRIGLWVGQRSTPNDTEDAHQWVTRTRNQGYAGGRSSPAQLTRCPWCGSTISPGKHIEVDRIGERTAIFCGDPLGRCDFAPRRSPGEGIPALVVDEEIYRLLPGLIIATVDKFAQMPWKGRVQALFGQVSRRCERHGFLTPDEADHPASHPPRRPLPGAEVVPAAPLRPPDLIIQDELHLIAGPLGSLVGLYESAVDRLCAWEVDGRVVRPKVVASTATIRRADVQVDQLFARGVAVFPPAGLDARDTFFARQRDRSHEVEAKPGRRYLGICAPGRRLKNVLIRVYVAQMAAAQQILEDDPRGDAYMTLVGYFNSLRELGGMRRLVEDDVTTRLGKAPERGLARRSRPILEELTSRRNAGDIPRILDALALEQVHPRPRKRDGAWPIDVLLATNMISVGVDVPRLGTMVCAGQPKATSEYIQATSRVGRRDPGLVITVYNWARPRDLSHYETFEHYHATLYRQVEALSVTPFAPRALDRGLTGVLAALVRLEGPQWSADTGAHDVDRRDARVQEAVDALAARAAGRGDRATGERVRATLKDRLDRWAEEQRVEGRRLGYRGGQKGTVYGLLRPPGPERWHHWTTPTSLREVEAPTTLVLREHAAGSQGLPPFEFPQRDGDEREEGDR